MNAHGTVSGDKKTGLFVRRLRSRAFRAGVREGIGSVALFFDPPHSSRADAVDASVAGAWKRVGDALNAATKTEGQRVGKTTREATDAK